MSTEGLKVTPGSQERIGTVVTNQSLQDRWMEMLCVTSSSQALTFSVLDVLSFQPHLIQVLLYPPAEGHLIPSISRHHHVVLHQNYLWLRARRLKGH